MNYSKLIIGIFIFLLALFFIDAAASKEKSASPYSDNTPCAVPVERIVLDLLMNDQIESARVVLDAWQKKKPEDIKIPFYSARVIFALAEFANEDNTREIEL